MYLETRPLNFYEQILREIGECNLRGKVPTHLNLTELEYKILLDDAYRMSKPFDVQDIDDYQFAGMEIQIYKEFDVDETTMNIKSYMN